MKAPINRIIPFSNVDGPGNRMAVFFQSCPFQCMYCHNPETIQMCIGCGKCVRNCPAGALSMNGKEVIWDENKCVQCDTCIKECPNLSSPKISWFTADDLVEKIKQVKIFIRGITVSGGECTQHRDFLVELFTKVKTLGLTCLIDSNGSYDFSKDPELMAVCDGVMLDVKAMDNEFHQKLTRTDNELVIRNLMYLLSCGKLEEVRTVILPTYPDENERTVREVSRLIQGKCRYKLLRYRPFGVRKEGLDFCGQIIASEEEAERLRQIAFEEGTDSVII